MWTKTRVVALLLLPFIAGCFAKPFQPPRAESQIWKKAGASEADVVRSMLACGEHDASGVDQTASLEVQAERFECMKRAGYTRSDGFDMCETNARHKLKACGTDR
ncbi:hypothetical protein OOJ96_24425 [Pseudomonas sp. 15FMM2]|uniref:Uncharacterized protein n=1 Tax=Pseudomonas imrae TaxID=2992837 RepID=A0ACC7PJT2_9PSED